MPVVRLGHPPLGMATTEVDEISGYRSSAAFPGRPLRRLPLRWTEDVVVGRPDFYFLFLLKKTLYIRLVELHFIRTTCVYKFLSL